ncbi:MAG: hypothetical protein ACP5EP_12110 [Acidobacteriaceae bacterium]
MSSSTQIDRNTQHDIQHLFRRLMLLPAVLVLTSLSMLGATVDGFVTKVDSQYSFNVGRLLIITNNQTVCSNRKVTSIRVEPASEYRGQPKISYLPQGLIASKRSTSIPCQIGKIAIGTRVHVIGNIQAAGNLQAKTLRIYTVRPTSVNNKSIAASLTTSSNHTDMLGGVNAKTKERDYKNTIPRLISVGYGEPLSIIQSQPVQEFVYELGMKLLQQCQPESARYGKSKIAFRFYVVGSSHALSMKKLSTVDGALPYNFSDWGRGEYTYKKSNFYDLATDNTIAMQNGLILIPDQVLSRLHNQAQLSALLSYSIVSFLQGSLLKSAIAVEGTDQYDRLHRFDEMLQINQQVLRAGIRQMYLAGYDIREAPFAWAVAQGKPVNNPIINSKDPDKEIPWYAAYAFNYISQYYKDVDYSKLKRGEKEYQQFLEELRKADPEAFAPQKAGSKQAAKVH